MPAALLSIRITWPNLAKILKFSSLRQDFGHFRSISDWFDPDDEEFVFDIGVEFDATFFPAVF